MYLVLCKGCAKKRGKRGKRGDPGFPDFKTKSPRREARAIPNENGKK
jgi:hypothetical protein